MPVFTDLPAAQLTLLGDQLASGFAAGHADMHFQPGSRRGRLRRGPGRARRGAGRPRHGRRPGHRVDPIKYRREFALKMGATTTLDPVAEGDGIVERVRELCRGPNDRRFAGGVTGAGRATRPWPRRGLRRRGGGLSVVAAEGRGAARSDQREDRAAGMGLHAHGRTRDADGVHAPARAVSRRVAGAARPDDSPWPAGRSARDARHPAVREADREGESSTRTSVITKRYTLDRKPSGGAGHRRPHDHHRRDRVHVIARREPRVPDSRERRR